MACPSCGGRTIRTEDRVYCLTCDSYHGYDQRLDAEVFAERAAAEAREQARQAQERALQRARQRARAEKLRRKGASA